MKRYKRSASFLAVMLVLLVFAVPAWAIAPLPDCWPCCPPGSSVVCFSCAWGNCWAGGLPWNFCYYGCYP